MRGMEAFGSNCFSENDETIPHLTQLGLSHARCTSYIFCMDSLDDIVVFLKGQTSIMELLAAVELLDLPDCWIGAGLIRNAVWDHLHSFPVEPHGSSDVDVVYYDQRHVTVDRDIAIEAQLFALFPKIQWSVHNQARMHNRNGDEPYHSTADAIRCWSETATAIAARTLGDDVEVIAPYGIDDLIGLVVRPTPAFVGKLDIYRKRVASKDWVRRWPRLTFIDV